MSQTTHVRVGDDDPNPSERVAAGTEGSCQAVETRDRWECTRTPGHDGPHIAGNGDQVCHVWPAVR